MASQPVPEATSQSNPRSIAAWAPHAFLTLIYFLTHSLGLLDRGLFWDDWVFWQQDKQLVAEVSRDMGSVWPTNINHWIFYSQFGITFGRLLSFAGLLVATLLLFGIVRRLPKMTDSTAFWIAALFAVYPGFTSREALVMTAYSLCLMFFLGAIWLNVRFSPKPKWWVHVAAVVLLFLSYHTRSLLVLSGFMPIVFLMADPPASWKLLDVIKRLLAYTGELVMPFLFFVMTKLWFQPRGLYADYNQFLSQDTQLSDVLWSGIVHSNPISIVWTQVTPERLALVAACIVMVPLSLWAWRRWSLEHNASDIWLLDSGLLLVLLAVAPYAAVGKIPMFSGFESRHQLLTPIGWGAIIVAIAQGHARGRWKYGRVLISVALAFTMGYFTAVHLQSYIGYEREWLKEQAMMEAFRVNPQIKAAHTILFVDRTEDWNAGHRSGRQHYEYSGMMAQVFGDQSRWGIERAHFKYIPDTFPTGFRALDHNQYYNLKDWTLHSPDIVVTIAEGKPDLTSSKTVVRYMLLDWTDRARLRKELAHSIKLTSLPYSWKPGQPLVDYQVPPQIPEY
ncbi:MAG TPA: hypothetical protein VFG89_02975 [Coriobacteriia bacterium]|nr:hypothetical protein [Coriobacteriia bacterium]